MNNLPIYTTDNGIPYIRYEDIAAVLPPHTKAEFDAWYCGQTAILLDDNTIGVYPWDWDNFLAHIEGRYEFFD